MWSGVSQEGRFEEPSVEACAIGMRFDETFDLVAMDRKTQTTRPLKFFEWYSGKEGKIIYAESPNPTLPQIAIQITSVFKCSLGEVASKQEHYIREGFTKGQEFIDAWKRLHGRFDPAEEVCVLRFVKV